MQDRGLAYFPENVLERILARAATDPAARPEFYRVLLDSDVFFLVPGAPNPGVHVAREGERAQLVTLPTDAGPIIPMFTAINRIRQVAPSRAYLSLRGESAFKMLSGQGHRVVLNPGFLYGKEFVPEEIRALADGSFFATEAMSSPPGIALGQPARHPAALVGGLSAFFAHEPSVVAAYIAQVHDGSSGAPPRPLVAIACDGDFQGVAGRFAVVLRELAVPEGPVDLCALEAGEIGDYFRREVKPFYVRGRSSS